MVAGDGFFMISPPSKTMLGFRDSGTFRDRPFGISYFGVPENVPESGIPPPTAAFESE